MAEGIVDLFELIQVDHQQGAGRRTASMLQRTFQTILEEPAVGQSG